MDERYLWDKSGDVDPFVARLEAALGRRRTRPRGRNGSPLLATPPRALARVGLVTALGAAALIAWLALRAPERDREVQRAPAPVAAPTRGGDAAPRALATPANGVGAIEHDAHSDAATASVTESAPATSQR